MTDGHAARRARTQRFEVEGLTRVEGEGSLHLVVRDGEVVEAHLGIFEAPRYFERLVARPDARRGPRHRRPHLRHLPGRLPDERRPRLRGRRRRRGRTRPSAPCAGCCTAASGSRATRSTSTSSTPPTSWATRAPSSSPATIASSSSGPSRLKKAGNHLVALVGGRPIHPVSVRVGGFYHVPTRSAMTALRPELTAALDIALETVAVVAGLEPPEFEREPRLVSLRHPTDYPMNEGRIVSTDGLDLAPTDWEDAFHEDQVGWSNALQARTHAGEVYLLGPSSRITLAGDRLHPRAAEALARTGLAEEIRRNPFRSIVARADRARPRHGRGARHHRRLPPAGTPVGAVDPRPGRRGLGDRGAARPALPPLRARRGRARRDGPDRAADQPEPGRHRGRPDRFRAVGPRPAARRGDASVRAAHPELRPVHLVRHALPRPARGGPLVTAPRPVRLLVCGNADRGDDGAALAAVAGLLSGLPPHLLAGPRRPSLRAARPRRPARAARGSRLRDHRRGRWACRPGRSSPSRWRSCRSMTPPPVRSRGRPTSCRSGSSWPSPRSCAIAPLEGFVRRDRRTLVRLRPGDRPTGSGRPAGVPRGDRVGPHRRGRVHRRDPRRLIRGRSLDRSPGQAGPNGLPLRSPWSCRRAERAATLDA